MSPTRACALRSLGRHFAVATALVLTAVPTLAAQSPSIQVVSDAAGSRLTVDGRDFMVLGMNWDYIPIGQNYAYNFWSQPDDFIKAALDQEMPLLKSMGVNTTRQYAGIPPRWVRFIYETYGIFTVLNHSMGRYGVTLGGVYHANTDYSDPRVRAVLIGEVSALVKEFRGTPGVLMWLLGNENNYGLTWKSAATEALPQGERDAAKARYLYSLFGEVIGAIKAIDPDRPVAMANGDIQYIDIIAEETKGLDVFGANVYRGVSVGNLFEVVKEKLGLPVMFTEFGSDAYNAKEMREDDAMQARYLIGQWQEIYEQSSGKGLTGNSIGGFTFQWSDGWWKAGQTERLDIHDDNASWPNGAYKEDFVAGDNNMNEEWWGITAKGPTDSRGHFELYPRAAFYALQRAYTLDPYGPSTDLAAIRSHFAAIQPTEMALRARGDRAAATSAVTDKVRVSGMRLELSTFSTGGTNISTPPSTTPSATASPSFKGFDHLESYYADIEAHPVSNVVANVSINILGNVPDNPIDQIFYENRGRTRTLDANGQPVKLDGLDRVKVYRANVSWDDRMFRLDGFYRTGHYHWGYEGDFFGLYREANYGANIDIYNGEAPLGVEISGKKQLAGLKFAIGPELWWGANPAVMAKYRRRVGNFDITGIYQDDIARQGTTSSSFAVPSPPTRKATLHIATTRGAVGIDVGGIWSGDTKVGETFQLIDGAPGSYRVLQDRIRSKDAFGAKAKLTVSSGRWNWYGQGAAMGLVADGGPTSVQTFTGWYLKDSGLGNQWNAITGVTYTFGHFQIAPNFLWQKPIVGPMPNNAPAPGRPRNILDDPFAVRANRQTTAGELLVTYDPTPATWMYAWDTDLREDAKLAVSAAFTYKHHPTTQDAAIGILADGRTTFPFPGAPPARDLWEVRTRIVSQLRPDLRFIVNLFGGTGEPNGDSPRLVHRYGGDMRLVKDHFKLVTSAKFNDWGPYDYHRDFNLTFPMQLMGDLSYSLGQPKWWDLPATRFGVRGTWRSLDRLSPRYCPATVANPSGALVCDPTAPGRDGQEWEIRTYMTVGW
ncbi:MAG: glycoside hydrolase family 2 TIM barrel-domain containing protein [Gemmatimonadota bacterium]|nr:glycoside hydrolase family 2 TIM barrel-domain containing protein [Gemmatimonadota bacterium]